MLAGVKLIFSGVAGVAGAGCLASSVIESGKDPIIWKVSSESSKPSPPILVCQIGNYPKIFVSLAFKGEVENLEESDNSEIILKASTENGEEISEDVFGFIFLKNGTSRIGESGGAESHEYGGDKIPCLKNIFVATKEKLSTQYIQWESPLKDVKLTLDSKSCKVNKECWVKIEDKVGLAWKWGSGVKIIFDK